MNMDYNLQSCRAFLLDKYPVDFVQLLWSSDASLKHAAVGFGGQAERGYLLVSMTSVRGYLCCARSYEQAVHFREFLLLPHKINRLLALWIAHNPQCRQD
jgi:hypothetical protein